MNNKKTNEFIPKIQEFLTSAKSDNTEQSNTSFSEKFKQALSRIENLNSTEPETKNSEISVIKMKQAILKIENKKRNN